MAIAIWPRPALATTCFVLGRCLGWELTPSKAASCVRAGRDDSLSRGLHVLPNLRPWWRTLVSLIAGPRSSSREAFWNVLRAAWSSSVELALRVCAWRGGIAGCRLWFHEHPWLWWPTVPMLALILSLTHTLGNAPLAEMSDACPFVRQVQFERVAPVSLYKELQSSCSGPQSHGLQCVNGCANAVGG